MSSDVCEDKGTTIYVQGCKRDSCDGVGVVRRNNKAEYLVVCNKCGLDGTPHISYPGAWRNWSVLQISTEF